MGQVSAGKLRPIACTGAKRSPVLPETPTFVEAGYPDLVVTSWSMWAVPAGTPAKAKDKLAAATVRALKEPDVVASMRQGGFEPGFMPLSEVGAFVKAEHTRWGEVIRAAGIKPQ
ncbi:Bug family tripartite tricarboxylate transporter substrate binding protein [Reyranella sp.]|uniref:Bug family tripartite tricarboxylate transporter substrate binding protein n=1 Tax=Reyranella sp. TaxID=1929291 RepID=UPI003D0ADBA6